MLPPKIRKVAPKSFTKIKSKDDILTLYKPILILMMLFGYTYNLTPKIIPGILLRIYSGLLTVIVSYSTMVCCNQGLEHMNQILALVWSLLEYTVFVWFLIFYRSKITLYFEKVIHIDTCLRMNNKYYYRKRNKAIVLLIIVSIVRMCRVTYSCLVSDCGKFDYTLAFYLVSLLALDINRVWRYCMFEDVLNRVKLMRMRIEEVPDSNDYLYVNDYKAIKEKKIKFFLNLYKSIGDLFDLISTELNASLLLSILSSLPKIIINVYYILLLIDKHKPNESIASLLIHLTQTSLFIFLPCIMVELCCAEEEKIRLYLTHRLFNETDPQSKEEIKVFLRYTYLRTFRYKIWRMVPVNLTLPLTIINLCTTYVIVVVNFTKVFT